MDGLDQPLPLRADCTSATACTACQGQLLPQHGDAAAHSRTAHQRVPRTAPSPADAPLLRPSCQRPEDASTRPPRHPRGPHTRTRKEAHAGGGPPSPARPPRLPAAARTGSPSSQRADLRGPAARAPPGGDACSSTAPRYPEGTEPCAGRHRGRPATPGRSGEHLPPSPGEAGSGQHRMRRLHAWPPPSSAGAPSCAALPAVGRRPCPTATPSPRTARTGGQGTRAPTPAPGAVYVSYVYHAPVCPLPALTHSLDPRPPWPPIGAPHQAPPAPRHALKPGEGPPGRAPTATPCGYGGSGAPGGPSPLHREAALLIAHPGI